MRDQFESFKPKPVDIEKTEITRRVVPFHLEKAGGPVDISIIECPHVTPEDTTFILEVLKDVSPGQTLFVEQGSPEQEDHLVFQLKKIASAHPDIREDFSQRQKYTWTILEGQENKPFAIASRHVASRKGSVVNMDLSARVDRAALDFITRESSLEFALERAYEEVKDACFDYQKTVPKILKLLFPEIPEENVEYACQQLYETRKVDYYLKRSKKIHEYWLFLREKFMHQTLESQAGSNDYALCHPNHAKKIRTARSEIVVPEKPEKLFELKK